MYTPARRGATRNQGGYIERAKRLVQLRNAMTDDFTTAINVLRSDREMTIEQLAEKATLSERTIQRMCKGGARRESLDNVLRLCFALRLEPELSEKLLANAGTPLLNTPEDMVYRMLLRDHYDWPLEDINEILLSEGMYPLLKLA